MRNNVAMETKIEVRVSNAEKDALKLSAAKLGKSVSELIRDAVQKYMAGYDADLH